MATQQTPLLRISVLHYRDRSKDEETWMKWYTEELIPRLIPIAHRHDIERVEFYFTTNNFRELFQADLNKLKGGSASGWNMAPYDAATIYWFSDPQKIRNMLSDPEWEGKLAGFEKGWNDLTKADVQIGTQTTYIEDGKIINTVTEEFLA